MGSAAYYLKADFPAGVDLEKVRNDAEKALLALAKFNDAWQGCREESGSTPMQRVEQLKNLFPQVWEDFSLDAIEVKPDDRVLNCFAGELCITSELHLEVKGNQLRLSDEVWHFADWTRIEAYFTKLGATNVASVSDEYSDPFEEW